MKLIDADKLMIRIADIKKSNLLTIGKIMGTIYAQPTAYDIDKVVEELEKASYDNSDWKYSQCEELASHYLLRLKDAIEIVKQGVR